MQTNEPQAANSLNNTLLQSFQMLLENKELVFQVLDMFPTPIEIFAPDGTSVFLNRAFIQFNNISDVSTIIGKYNILNDPVVNDQLGYREEVQRAFRGETISISDFPCPIQDLVDRGSIGKKPFESATMDCHLFPVWNGDQLAYIVFTFFVKNVYQGRPEVAKVKEYIDKHWQDEFDPQQLAHSVNMSVSQLYSVFKKHTGMAPGEYQKKCKVDHIMEKLADKNLNINEAFFACGEDSRGTYARIFKEITGVSPRQFRKQISE